MKLARLRLDHGPTLVAVTDDGSRGVAVADVLPGLAHDVDAVEVLGDPGCLAQLRTALADRPDPLLGVQPNARTLRPVRRVPRVLAIGLNYRDHAAEVGIAVPTAPLMFARWASSLTDPFTDVVVPGDVITQLDYEVELAAVVGHQLHRASVAEAEAAIVGWTVANDISARDLQFADGQWSRGKNVDGTCPIGPTVAPADEVDPADLAVRCWVDDELRQDSSTDQLVFTTAEVLAHLSATMRIEPGDVVLTGTPPGVAMGSPEPRWLEDGQVVRCEVEGIGATINRIRFEPAQGTTPPGTL